MQPFRFIHCGDLHLGAPFQYATGISRAVDRAVSEATYVSFDTIIDTAIDGHVHAVVIAGDIYNSEDHNLGGTGALCARHVSFGRTSHCSLYGAR